MYGYTIHDAVYLNYEIKPLSQRFRFQGESNELKSLVEKSINPYIFFYTFTVKKDQLEVLLYLQIHFLKNVNLPKGPEFILKKIRRGGGDGEMSQYSKHDLIYSDKVLFPLVNINNP